MIKYPPGRTVSNHRPSTTKKLTPSKNASNTTPNKKRFQNLNANRSIKISKKTDTTFGKRGMNFEAEINATNEYYLSHHLAVVHKKPTPIQIVKVDYPKRSRAKIVEAYFRQASTTDYSGVWQGHYIDFEAKETQQKTSFPLKNFHEHQIVHMENVIEQGGIAFVLLHFSALEETYYLSSQMLIKFYRETQGLKSIPIDFIKAHGLEIETHQIPRIPYLDILKKQYEVN